MCEKYMEQTSRVECFQENNTTLWDLCDCYKLKLSDFRQRTYFQKSEKTKLSKKGFSLIDRKTNSLPPEH